MSSVGDILNISKCGKYFVCHDIGGKPHYCTNIAFF